MARFQIERIDILTWLDCLMIDDGSGNGTASFHADTREDAVLSLCESIAELVEEKMSEAVP